MGYVQIFFKFMWKHLPGCHLLVFEIKFQFYHVKITDFFFLYKVQDTEDLVKNLLFVSGTIYS